jgi:hypothetical protein
VVIDNMIQDQTLSSMTDLSLVMVVGVDSLGQTQVLDGQLTGTEMAVAIRDLLQNQQLEQLIFRFAGRCFSISFNAEGAIAVEMEAFFPIEIVSTAVQCIGIEITAGQHIQVVF